MTKKNMEELPVCDVLKQRHQVEETWIVHPRYPRLRILYITIDHRLGFAPRFYRFSNPSRYFCQLYHRLSPGVPVTRKQPGDIIRACPRKSIHSGWEFPHMRVKGLGMKFDIEGRLAALSTISISREIRSPPFQGILTKLLEIAIHITWRDNVCVLCV